MYKKSILLLLCLLGQVAVSQPAWTQYSFQNSVLPDNSVRSIALVNDSTAWVGTEAGLAKLSGSSWTLYPAQTGGLSWNDVRSIYVDSLRNKTWFGTFNGGLCSFDGNTWVRYTTLNSLIADDHIRSIGVDTLGNVWAGGGGGGGLSVLDTAGVITTYNVINSLLGSNNIASIYIDSNNNKYLGTVNGGLLMIQDTTWQNFTINNSGIPDNTVLDITKDDLGNLWLATPGNGLVLKLPAFGWFKYIPVNSSLLSYGVLALAFDKPRNLLWCGTYDAGLARKDGSTFTHFMSGNSGLNDIYVQSLKLGSDGRLWIGTHNAGLFILDPSMLTALPEWVMDAPAQIFPNPSNNGYMRVECNKTCEMAIVYDLNGSERMKASVNDFGYTLDLQAFASGMYLLHLQFADGTYYTKKIAVR